LINLIDNAIKYTDQGKISVTLQQDTQNVKLTIADTGPGIPEDALDHIFERFYVVDKSRSRAAGGTGLGLSIVKHIVIIHKGRINVESTPGRGTAFVIIFPG
ncbi:MAG: ATP-binding protein, partial [Candidatus Margulisiibacteriota bacterium]